MTCATWHQVSQDPALWRRLYSHERGTIQIDSGPRVRLSEISVDWYNLYKQRTRLNQNWMAGRFVNPQLPHPNHPAEGHTDDIYAIQLQGKHLVSGSVDRTIRIWDVDTGRLVGEPLQGHAGSVLCLQFDPRDHEDTIVSGGAGGELIFWVFSTRTKIKIVSNAHGDAVTCLKFDQTRLVTCSQDETIKVWDRMTLSAQILTGHRGSVNAIDFSGDTLVSASGDRTVKVWSISENVCLRTVEEPRSVACVRLHGDWVMSGGRDGCLRMYNALLDPQGAPLFGHSDLVRTFQARLTDGPTETIVSGSYDGSVLVWMRTSKGHWCARRVHRHDPARRCAGVAATWRISDGTSVSGRVHRSTRRSLETLCGPVASSAERHHGLAAHAPAGDTATDVNHPWIFGVDINDRRLAYCSNNATIMGLGFADNDPEIVSFCDLELALDRTGGQSRSPVP
ncbi:hypothetical protein LTR59_002201 [Friedmanniomyces endolithicus]|nr:hypothetical protein LTR59_002201 [Friedmanniomyces endolithicus]